MSYSMYSASDKQRVTGLAYSAKESYRSEWRQDYARLIHSPSFRRLQGKTQLFPASETDFFRNRLTHSIEVSQIAKDIAIKINSTEKFPDGNSIDIDLDLVEFAALAHDLGHPPFGHQGEEALDECMVDDGGYEGNAQTLRILCKIEKKIFQEEIFINGEDKRLGLDLCYRTLASILKYNAIIPYRKTSRDKFRKQKGQDSIKVIKGIYESEKKLVTTIKNKVLAGKKSNLEKFKTVECYIMDIADDISNSTYDLEDVLKAGFNAPVDFLYADDTLIEKVRKSVSKEIDIEFTTDEIRAIIKDIFQRVFDVVSVKDLTFDNQTELSDFLHWSNQLLYNSSKQIAESGYNRVAFTSSLVKMMIDGTEFKLNEDIPALSIVRLNDNTRIKVEVLKRFTYEVQILSPKLKIAEFRGKDIVKKVFDTLNTSKGHELLPKDYRELYQIAGDDRKRIICDFIAGMTDKYLIEFYGRLTSEMPETIFKPI